jgi:hypothetical protein
MRKGYDGLAAAVQQILKRDPFSGQLFLFRGKRGSQPDVAPFLQSLSSIGGYSRCGAPPDAISEERGRGCDVNKNDKGRISRVRIGRTAMRAAGIERAEGE